MSDKKPDEYHFLKEQTKKVPLNKKRLGKQIGIAVLLGVIIGVVAALVFCGMNHLLDNKDQDSVEAVDFSADEEETQEVDPGTEADEVQVVPAENGETTETEEDAQEGQAADEQQAAVYTPTIEDYQNLQDQLYAIGQKANGFVVSVTCVTSNEDWFHSDYETEGQGTGIILAETSTDYRVVTNRTLLTDTGQIQVTFQNDITSPASLLAYDSNTDLAVLSVKKADIDKDAREGIAVAELGSSYNLVPGTLTVAIGSPQGTPFSILTGGIVSSDGSISGADANYGVLTTNITSPDNATGALVNTDGKIIGLIFREDADEESTNTLTAYGISDLRKLLENLTNGKAPAYLGIQMNQVTESVAKDYNLPEGIYVKSVDMDSPAMYAGIQTGDVITSINKVDMTTEADYESWILNAQNGTEARIVLQRQGSDGGYQEVECSAMLNTAN